MSTNREVPAQYGDVRQCIRAAKANMDEVRQLLSRGSVDSVELCASTLREIEVQLGCAVAILRAGGASHPSPETRSMLEDLQREAAMLAQLFAEADKLFTGWLRTIQTKRAGYTGRGQAAPLQLVGRMSLEG
ncbi:MAG: hypothetical protein LAP38_17590 [Acidobacteriia bacterium]|nr:hypothetical protein [Terriglobia bacterium]